CAHRGALEPPHELVADEGFELLLALRALASADLRDGARPEDPPDHGSDLQQRLPLARQRVEPGSDHRAHGLRCPDLRVPRELQLPEPTRSSRSRSIETSSSRKSGLPPARPTA